MMESDALHKIFRAATSDPALRARRGAPHPDQDPGGFLEISYGEDLPSPRALDAHLRGDGPEVGPGGLSALGGLDHPCSRGCWLRTCICLLSDRSGSFFDPAPRCDECGAPVARQEMKRIPAKSSGWDGVFCSWKCAAAAALNAGGDATGRLGRIAAAEAQEKDAPAPLAAAISDNDPIWAHLGL